MPKSVKKITSINRSLGTATITMGQMLMVLYTAEGGLALRRVVEGGTGSVAAHVVGGGGHQDAVILASITRTTTTLHLQEYDF